MHLTEPEGVELHPRSYEVSAYSTRPGELLRGRVMDEKPPGVYFENNSEPLEIHHMVIDVSVSVPDLIITNAIVLMETHPHEGCIKIVDHSKKLVGLPIALGFTKKVRELFGGPRGCSHKTALLNAMAPVAIQSVWGTEGREFKSPQPDTQFAGQGRSFGAGPPSFVFALSDLLHTHLDHSRLSKKSFRVFRGSVLVGL